MKSLLARSQLVCLAILLVPTWRVAAQTYALDSWTVNGGGGTSTGAVYAVSGAIGPHDAGYLSGTTFSLQGGFWGIVAAVQSTGAPRLEVARSAGAVVVWWLQPAEGWRLEYSSSVAPGSRWTEIAPPYQTNGTSTISYTQTLPVGSRFYRLRKP